jgi:hypothetical protein
VIYRDAAGAPGALAAVGPEQVITPAAGGEWIALPLATPVSLAPGTYWLGILTGDVHLRRVHPVVSIRRRAPETGESGAPPDRLNVA